MKYRRAAWKKIPGRLLFCLHAAALGTCTLLLSCCWVWLALRPDLAPGSPEAQAAVTATLSAALSERFPELMPGRLRYRVVFQGTCFVMAALGSLATWRSVFATGRRRRDGFLHFALLSGFGLIVLWAAAQVAA